MTADGGTPGPGGPAHLPPVSTTPDWAALAEAREREERRRRTLRAAGGALAVAVVAGLVAGALVLTRPSTTPAAAPVGTAQPDGPAPTADDTPGAAPTIDPSAGPSTGPSAAPSASGSGKPTGSPTGKATATPGRDKQPSGTPATLPGLLLGGGATIGRTEGHDGPTMVLYGNGVGWADSQTPVVDTSRSFTVSAVVRNNAPTGGRAVVTQGGDSYYSFYLGRDYWGTHNQWVFKVQTAAGAQDNTTYQAFSTAPATTGRWTLLTGVYDASAKKILLYVNGQLQQSTPVTGIWQTTGGLQLGRVRYKSQWTDFWDGAISDVQVWDQALPASAVGRLQGSGGTTAGTAPGRSWLLP
ncbi:LamG domain-containing protein [Kitasatospora phosalacinea]|uniref:LamG domain-containing protein n=1 Tax=Kitasatospora phosalacinea TaxID=2065 RepID=UPI0025568E26|nr:LamG-like jellyroll fold domain-containing protein [Kitasatospora phosalacinea]